MVKKKPSKSKKGQGKRYLEMGLQYPHPLYLDWQF